MTKLLAKKYFGILKFLFKAKGVPWSHTFHLYSTLIRDVLQSTRLNTLMYDCITIFNTLIDTASLPHDMLMLYISAVV